MPLVGASVTTIPSGSYRAFDLQCPMRMLLWFRKEKFKTLALEILEQKKLRAPGTLNAAKFRLNRLITHFGDVPVAKIDESAWRAFVLDRLKKRPGCKIFDDRKYMLQVMLEAHRRGLTRYKLKLMIPDLPSSVGRELKEWEIRRLLRHAGPVLKFQIEIAYLMGLRLREMMHLRWDQFDWERKTIRFLASETKTRRERETPINPKLLQKFRKKYLKGKSPCLFARDDDPFKSQYSNKTAWRTCKRKAGVKARWNDLRHTAATRMLRQRNSMRAVANYLGNSVRVLPRYDHPDIEDLRRIADRMSGKRRSARL